MMLGARFFVTRPILRGLSSKMPKSGQSPQSSRGIPLRSTIPVTPQTTMIPREMAK
jgi:hypothetical protein